MCAITDNNAINTNGEAMSYFATPPRLSIVYTPPVDKTDPYLLCLTTAV